MLRLDPAYAEKAAQVSALAKDVTEFLATLDLPEPAKKPDLTVAYHSACSMQHGQKITRQPKELLQKAGFTVKEPREGHLCCGSAGTYNIMQPEISARLLDRKVKNIEATGAALVATGNIGCITQIASAAKLPVVHTVELLDWAYGGKRPAGVPEGMSAGMPLSECGCDRIYAPAQLSIGHSTFAFTRNQPSALPAPSEEIEIERCLHQSASRFGPTSASASFRCSMEFSTPMRSRVHASSTPISSSDPNDRCYFLAARNWADHQNVIDVQVKRPYRDEWHAALDDLLEAPRDIAVWQPLRSDGRRKPDE